MFLVESFEGLDKNSPAKTIKYLVKKILVKAFINYSVLRTGFDFLSHPSLEDI